MENERAREKVFYRINDSQVRPAHGFPMGKKADSEKAPWYPNEWLAVTGKRQADLVKASGYDKSYVSLLLSGQKRWNETILHRFSKALGVSPGALLEDPRTKSGRIVAAAHNVPPERLEAALAMLEGLARKAAS
jgi:hypothetical protein